jgi:hypothetical protein
VERVVTALTSQVIDLARGCRDGRPDVDPASTRPEGTTVTTSTSTRTSTSAPASAEGPSPLRRHRRAVLAVDAAGCAAIGAGLVAASGWFAGELGLATSTPVLVTSGVFAVAAATNLLASRDDRRGPAITAIELDVTFALALLVAVLAGLPGASPLGRGSLVATAAVSSAFAAAKLAGLPPRGSGTGSHAAASR